jgi:hypothetical protein
MKMTFYLHHIGLARSSNNVYDMIFDEDAGILNSNHLDTACDEAIFK